MSRYGLQAHTTPTVEPIKTSEAKAHLRVDTTDENTLIDRLVTAARLAAENYTKRCFVNQKWNYQLDDWPSEDVIDIPLPRLQSIVSTGVTYKTTDATVHTFGSSNYVVDTVAEPGRIKLKDHASWPSTELQAVGGVNIRFTAGYGSSAGDVPQHVKQALLLIIGHWYANREQVVLGDVPREIPLGAKWLLDPEVIHTF